MFISAVLHMCLLLLYFFITKDSTPLNFFSIIGLNLFYPEFVSSNLGQLLSYVVSIFLYIIGYAYLTTSKK